MTTMFEDALSVLGENDKELIEQMEAEYQKNPMMKSDVEQIIIKSIVSADEEIKRGDSDSNDLNQQGYRIITTAEFKPLYTFIRKLADGGKITITEDDTTRLLDEMLHWLSSYYEDKSDKPKGNYGTKQDAGYADPGYQKDEQPRYPLKINGELSEKRIRAAWNYIHQERNAAKYSNEDLKKIKDRIIAAWKDKIGGTPPSVEKSDMTDMEDEQDKCPECGGDMKDGKCTKCDYQEDETMKDHNTMKSEGDNNKMSENIEVVSGQKSDTVNSNNQDDKLAALELKFEQKFNDLVTKLTATVENKEVKSDVQKDEKVDNVIVNKFSEMFGQALIKSGVEQQAALQEILNTLGKDFADLVKPEQKSEVENVDVKSVVKEVVGEELTTVNQQIGLLATQMKDLMTVVTQSQASKQVVNKPIQVQAPQLKAVSGQINTVLPQPVTKSKGLKISDIVRKTTVGY